MKKNVFPIQALRAIAALSVALSHFSTAYWQMIGGADQGPLYPLAAGVDLFFVISGFVMVYSSEGLFGQPGASFTFIRHRLARIVPIYWLTSAVAIWLTGESFDLRSLIGSYFFIPFMNANGQINPLYGVGWTLNFEMYFYAVFATCLFFRRSIALGLLAATLLTAVALGQLIWMHHAALIVWTDPIILEFLFGAFVALLYRRAVTLPAPVRGAMIVAALIAIFQFHVPELPSHYRWVEWGVPAALIAAACVLGTQRWISGPLGSAAQRLGDASYSLYLLHAIVLATIFNSMSFLGGHAVLLLLPGYLTAIAASLVIYRYFERPMTDFLKRSSMV